MVKRLRLRITSPPIVPPAPSDRKVMGPVTVAAMSSRSSKAALSACSARSMPTPPMPLKVKRPVPLTDPPFCALAPKLPMTSWAPENRPRAFTLRRRMPVTGLLMVALSVASWPLICGLPSVPRMSAETLTGPPMSTISTPVSRQSVSAVPPKRSWAKSGAALSRDTSPPSWPSGVSSACARPIVFPSATKSIRVARRSGVSAAFTPTSTGRELSDRPDRDRPRMRSSALPVGEPPRGCA